MQHDLQIRRQNFYLKSCVQRQLDEIVVPMPADVGMDSAQRFHYALPIWARNFKAALG